MLSLLLLIATPLFPDARAPAPAPVETKADTHGKIPWFTGTFEEALAKAKAENKVVFVDFWTSWCIWCKKLDKDTYSDDSVVAFMKDVICLNIDAESKTGEPLAKRYGVTGFPTLAVFESDGAVRAKVASYLTPAQFKTEFGRILSKPSLTELRARVEADKTNVDKRWELASRLMESGDQPGFDLQIAEIKKLDPEGKSLAMHFIAMQEVIKRVDALWQQRKPAETPALLKDFLARETYPEVQFRAWNVLGQIYGALVGQAATPEEAQRYNLEARNAQMMAWRTSPDGDALGFGKQILRELSANKDKLSEDDKGFALEVAERVERLGASDSEAIDLAAGAHFMNGKKDDAQRLARRAIELDPKNAEYKKRLTEFGG